MRKKARDVIANAIREAALEMDPNTPDGEMARNVDLRGYLQREWDDIADKAALIEQEEADRDA